MRYLILLCAAVAILLFSPIHQAVASPSDTVGDCQGASYAAGPCGVVALDQCSVVGDQSYAYTVRASITMSNLNEVRVPEVLLRDFDGVRSIARSTTSREARQATTVRSATLGKVVREAVPRRTC